MYVALLQCGHLTEIEDIDGCQYLECSHCGVVNPPQAIECREWVVYCQEKWCRFREVVADRALGEHVRMLHKQVKHQGKGSCVCDFLAPEHLKKLVKSLYGPKVKPFILDSMDRVKYVKYMSVKVEDENLEVPPFLPKFFRQVGALAARPGKISRCSDSMRSSDSLWKKLSVLNAAGLFASMNTTART